MHPDEAALLRTICDSPDDDTPRLVYADWLQENGRDERAEFIRTQIERSRLDEYAPRYAELEVREKQLLKTHQREWIKPIPTTAFGLFNRGFVHSIQPRLEAWVKWAKKVVYQQPVQKAWFRREPYSSPIPIDLWTKFCNMQELATIPSLSWAFSPLTNEHIRILTGTTHLTQLRGLDFHYVPLREPDVWQLLAWPSSASIRELNLSSVHLADPTTASEIGQWSELRELEWAQARFGLEHCRMLAQAPWRHLRHLYLGWNPIDAESIAAFASSSWWETLEELIIPSTSLNDRGVIELAKTSMPGLRKLTLWNVRMSADGARALGRATWLSQLRHLGLDQNDLRDYGLQLILDGIQGTQLRELEIRSIGLSQFGIEHLANCPAMAGVVSISMCELPINEIAAKALADSPHLQNVRHLNITNCPCSRSSLRVLENRFGTALWGAKATRK